MHVYEVMSKFPHIIDPNCSLTQAAQSMDRHNCGILPVGIGEDDLNGMITDRDIVVYGIAAKKDPDDTKVGEIMSPEVISCSEDDTLEEAADRMIEYDVSRLVVRNKSEKLVGIVSIADLVKNTGDELTSDSVIHHLLQSA